MHNGFMPSFEGFLDDHLIYGNSKGLRFTRP